MTRKEIQSNIVYQTERLHTCQDYLRNFNEMFNLSSSGMLLFPKIRKGLVNRRRQIKWYITRSRNIIKKLSAL